MGLRSGHARRRATTLVAVATALLIAAPALAESVVLTSPDGRAAVVVEDGTGDPTYRISWRGSAVLAQSKLGFTLEQNGSIGPGMRILAVRRREGVDRYVLPMGSRSEVEDRYREASIDLAEPSGSGRQMTLVMRAYNGGAAFRYRIAKQPGLTQLRLAGEQTEFAFPSAYDCTGFNVGHFGSSHEGEFDSFNAASIRGHTLFDLPLMCRAEKGSFAITEANLHDYAGMYLAGRGTGELGVAVSMAPHPDDKWVAVTADLTKGALETPWRVVLMGDSPGEIVPSTIVTSLNPAPAGDFSWVKPGKYAWDWWNGPTLAGVAHAGMNDETIRSFINFAADAHLPYMMVDDGWYVNSGTAGQVLAGADATRVIPGFDLPGLVDYARTRGVRLIVWINWQLLDRDMERVLSSVERMGVAGIKVDFMDRDDQAMVAFHDRLISATARHHLLLDLHGAFVPRGTVRTWPNYITQEGVMGAEYNKWSRRVTARHNIALAFTRAMLGPADYTPGGFRNMTPETFVPTNAPPQVQTTRGQALALYVAFLSPLGGVADTPDVYRKPGGGWEDGFDFIQEVPTQWDETRVLSGAPGESIVIARRKGQSWYLGAMTDAARTVTVPLDFLGPGAHPARIWADGATPAALAISERDVSRDDALTLRLSRAGGAAVRIGAAR
ncbi:glycoside hydrolase family 97 protein [Sphingomonas sp. BAUL-RG-20F-R05-02]|uniref:glycoside hydrolase family 97 protein n=1 Tax=Sphingomonas sp. BAUL-RG-20F-R05-02 TaxID=2914830 RepID=UPI001F580AE7|nr:glycoside hydrolase family 97 protein [Sphingomonas sp. BAUL-RG-20F-R05-02]